MTPQEEAEMMARVSLRLEKEKRSRRQGLWILGLIGIGILYGMYVVIPRSILAVVANYAMIGGVVLAILSFLGETSSRFNKIEKRLKDLEEERR